MSFDELVYQMRLVCDTSRNAATKRAEEVFTAVVPSGSRCVLATLIIKLEGDVLLIVVEAMNHQNDLLFSHSS